MPPSSHPQTEDLKRKGGSDIRKKLKKQEPSTITPNIKAQESKGKGKCTALSRTLYLKFSPPYI
jgi:hypothetical protein